MKKNKLQLKNFKVLVLIPTYNDKISHLKQSIYSILKQNYPNFDLLIINDGGSNALEIDQIVNSFRDQRVIVIHKEINSGLSNTLNEALLKFKYSYDYIIRMDADDISRSNRLSKLLTYMQKNPDVDLCSSWGFSFGSSTLPQVFFLHTQEIVLDLLFRSPILHAGIIYRSQSLIKHQIKYKNIPAEDYDLWFRLSKINGFKFANIPYYLYFYRITRKIKPDLIVHQNNIMMEIHKYYLPHINQNDRKTFIDVINNGYYTGNQLLILFDIVKSIGEKFIELGFERDRVYRTLLIKIQLILIKSNIRNKPLDLKLQKYILNSLDEKLSGNRRIHKEFLMLILYKFSYYINKLKTINL